MRFLARVVLPVIAAATLLIGWSAPASAAPPNPSMPGAVVVSATGEEKGAVVRVTNNGPEKLAICGIFLFHEPTDPTRDQPQWIWSPVDIQPGQTRQTEMHKFPMPNGNYSIYWNCSASENGRDVWWGTHSPFQPKDRNWAPTARPTPVAITAPACLGPLCIPPGFGF